MQNVLIVEDNLAMLRGLQDNFELKGYRVRTAIDGEQGLEAVLAEKPDLIILDIVLPGLNGYELCSLVREKNSETPIIMLTAKNEESDQILGFNSGADDYVTKPFSIKVLLARVQALLRRQQPKCATYNFGTCQLDFESNILTRDGKEVTLSPGESKLLRLFLARAGHTMSREEILTAAWGYTHFISLHDVDRFVERLRSKIEPNPSIPTFIHAVGLNDYRFEVPQADGNSVNN